MVRMAIAPDMDKASLWTGKISPSMSMDIYVPGLKLQLQKRAITRRDSGIFLEKR